MTTLVGWRFEKASNANEGNVRELSRMGGDEGTLDFAAEGQRGRGSRDFVLIRAAGGIGGSILPESLTTDHTNLHGCPGLVSFPQGIRAMGHGGDEGTLDFAAEGRRGRGSRDFVLISATSAPLPLSAKPDRLSRPWLEMSFADRSNANEGNVGELSRMDPN